MNPTNLMHVSVKCLFRISNTCIIYMYIRYLLGVGALLNKIVNIVFPLFSTGLDLMSDKIIPNLSSPLFTLYAMFA